MGMIPPCPCCAICGRDYKPYRKGRCPRCDAYFRWHGKERPLDHPGRGQFHKPKTKICANCGVSFDAIYSKPSRNVKHCSVACYNLGRARKEEKSVYLKKWNAKQTKEYKDAHNKKCREYYHRIKKTDPLMIKGRCDKRRARKYGSQGTLSKNIPAKLLDRQRGKCSICGIKLDRNNFHIDHIMPLFLGGEHSDRNVQATCPICNLNKGAKHPIIFMRERGYLL